MEIQPTLDPVLACDCEYCKSPTDTNDIFCQQCGFPVKGTDEEKQQFHYNIGYKQIQLEDSGTSIRKGRNSLYVVAAVFVVFGLISYSRESDGADTTALVVTNLALGVIFLLLAFWSTSKPIAALISGLSLYLAVQLLNFIVEPVSLFQGVIMKVFVIIYLVRALQSAFDARKLSRELKVK